MLLKRSLGEGHHNVKVNIWLDDSKSKIEEKLPKIQRDAEQPVGLL